MNEPAAGTLETGAERSGAVLNPSRSHWWNTSDPYVPSPPLQGDRQADICIIGGGINGISTAYHLKKTDSAVDVVLLEAEVIGYGASGRNAGQVITKFGGTSADSLVQSFGAENAGIAWDYVHRGIDLIAGFAEEEKIDCDYNGTGTLYAALRVDGDAHLERTLGFIEQMGQARYFSFIDRSQIEKELNSPYIGAALYDSRGGQFNPLKLVRGLKAAAMRRGARIFENSPVATIQIDRGGILVHTGLGSVQCKKLVLATNAFTHLVGGANELGLGREQTPLIVKGLVTEPLTDAQWERAGWPRRCGVNIQSKLFYSFAPTPDRRILYVGGYYTSAPWDRNLQPEIDWRLKVSGPEHLEAFFPAFKELKTVQTWGGPISITPDWIPHVGHADDPRILYACGCWGNGMPCGTQNGRTLADLALDRDTDDARAWFVQRKKRAWPSRTLAAVLATGVIVRRRLNNRKVGKTMNPPLKFKT